MNRWVEVDSIGSGEEPVAGFCENGKLFFDKLSDCQLFKEYPAPWTK
jgi:hypothetical protein